MIRHAGLIARRVDGDWRGALIEGPSGIGKSDLALRLIDAGGSGLSGMLRRAELVADDLLGLADEGGVLGFEARDGRLEVTDGPRRVTREPLALVTHWDRW